MVADVVRAVGGPHVEVVQLMGPGIDPHLYKASPGDVDALIAADVIVYSGLHLEGKLADLFAKMAARKPTIGLAEAIPADRLLRVAESAVDPHVWFDVQLWSTTVKPLAEALAKFDPPHADDYRSGATKYTAELDALDTSFVRPHGVPLTAVHPMGTLRMGDDPKTSVVRSTGEHHFVDGLFVADGSLFPTSLGGPPQISIYSFALHVAPHAVARAGR